MTFETLEPQYGFPLRHNIGFWSNKSLIWVSNSDFSVNLKTFFKEMKLKYFSFILFMLIYHESLNMTFGSFLGAGLMPACALVLTQNIVRFLVCQCTLDQTFSFFYQFCIGWFCLEYCQELPEKWQYFI